MTAEWGKVVTGLWPMFHRRRQVQ